MDDDNEIFEDEDDGPSIEKLIEQAREILRFTGYEVVKERTLEDIHPADREYSSPYRNKYGDKVTANGIDWSERMLDGDYIHTVTHGRDDDEYYEDERYYGR